MRDRNEPQRLNPKCDPRRPPAATELVEAAVEQLGHSRPTRFRFKHGRTLSARSQSRRDHFQPGAKEHVRRYLMWRTLKLSARALAVAYGVHVSTIYRSLVVGRTLAQTGAEARGFRSPDGTRWERDAEGDFGCSEENGGAA